MLDDPDFKGNEYVGKVKSKGGEWRDFVILSDDFKDLLRKIFLKERGEMDDNTYLFNYITESKKEKGKVYKYDKLPKSATM